MNGSLTLQSNSSNVCLNRTVGSFRYCAKPVVLVTPFGSLCSCFGWFLSADCVFSLLCHVPVSTVTLKAYGMP